MTISLAILALAGAGAEPVADATACRPALICGLKNAEDLERIEGTPWIIASSVGGPDLYRLDVRDGSRVDIEIDWSARSRARQFVHDTCAGPPGPGAFVGHGIAVRQGRRPRLYAVNHARRTIEIFDIDRSNANLTWRSCVVTPADMSANGIAPLPRGAIAATKYATPGKDFTAGMAAGAPTGDVRIWQPGRGWSKITGSEASVANGIAASPDGKRLFVTVTGTREVWRIDLSGANPLAIVRGRLDFSPDNLRWTGSGTLLTAGFNGSAADAAACFARTGCTLDYSVAEIDPQTLRAQLIAKCPGTAEFGNASAALEVGDNIWVGTFRGHAIAKVSKREGSPGECPG